MLREQDQVKPDLLVSPAEYPLCDRFLKQGGRIRLSLTGACSLRCTFCHREGGLKRGQSVLDALSFALITNQFYHLGGHEVNLTGGEPTLFSGLAQLLDNIQRPEHAKLSLTTNGIEIQPLLSIHHKAVISTLNVSLHGWDRAFLCRTISPDYDLRRVCANIQVLARNFKVCVNFTLMRDNCDQFLQVAKFAMTIGAEIKVINFQEVSWNFQRSAGQFVHPEKIGYFLEKLADQTGTTLLVLPTSNGFGALRKQYRVGKMLITVIDGSAQHRTMRVCASCRFASICKEGFYAIRLYSDGTLAPCLHRDDLVSRYRKDCTLAENLETLLEALL